MIEKEIIFDDQAKERLFNGVTTLAKAVKTTLGAGGKTVILEDQLGRPHVTKDGVTVAKSINLEDPVEHLAASILKQVAIKSATEAGDGTTTSIVIAESIIKSAFYNEEVINVTLLRNEIEYVKDLLIQELETRKKEVTEDNLVDVATISANGDAEMGQIIADAYNKVGIEGAVTIEESMDGNTFTKIIEGTRLKKGYHSPYLINDSEKNQSVLEKPYIAICDKKVTTIEDIEPLLQEALVRKRPIVFVADIDTAVMNTLNVNKARGVLQVNVIAPEGIGRQRFELLEDLAVMTGATVISDETGSDFSAITADFLGQAKKCTSSESESVIVLNEVNQETLDRAEMVRNAIKKEKDLWHLKDRLARLAGGIAAIHVGALTEVEMKEKKDRAEDAIWATRAALEEGIVAGGGIALFNVSSKLSTLSKNTTGERKLAFEVMIEAIQAPLWTILKNADVNPVDFVDKMNKIRRRNYGVDVKKSRFGNMFDMGVIDPLKVTKNAVKNAVSAAITILTTNCVVSNKRA